MGSLKQRLRLYLSINSILRYGFAIAAVLPIHGQILIDNFDKSQAALSSSGSSVMSGSMLGTERDHKLTFSVGAPSLEVGNGVLTFSQQTGVGIADIVWDGVDHDGQTVTTSGLGNLDLTAGSAREFLLGINRCAVGATLEIRVYSPSGLSFGPTLAISANDHPSYVSLPYVWFQGSADFANVGAIELILHQQAGGVVAIDFLRTSRGSGQSFNATATLTDTVLMDLDNSGKASSGDVLRYRGIIENAHFVAKEAVLFSAAKPPNTSFGTVSASPLARNDAPTSTSAPGDPFHTAIDTPLSVSAGDASQNLLANDFRGLPAATIGKFGGGSLGGTVNSYNLGSTISSNGHSMRINSDGSFTYTPPSGFSGFFTSQYLLTNLSRSVTGAVTIAVGPRFAPLGLLGSMSGQNGMNSDARAQPQVPAAVGDLSLQIGALAVGEWVRVAYDVIIDKPTPAGVSQISSQATVSGNNFATFSTDDPETTAANDATITTLQTAAPVVTAGNTVNYSEGRPSEWLAQILRVTDAESGTLVGATVTVTSGYTPGDEFIYFGAPRVALAQNGNTLTASGVESVEYYGSLLRSLFFHTSDRATAHEAAPTKTVSFVVNNGFAWSAPATTTIQIIDSLPVISFPDGRPRLTYIENGIPLAFAPTLVLEDSEGDTEFLSGATIGITNGMPDDVLGFVSQNGITGNYDPTTRVLQLSGAASVPDYQAALRSVTYSSTSENPVSTNRYYLPTIRDVFYAIYLDDAWSAGSFTITLDIQTVNDAPLAGTDTIFRTAGKEVKARLSSLLTNDVDPENNLIRITAVASSTPGAAVTISEGWVYYTNPSGSPDSFTYTLMDGFSATSSGTVNVLIQDQNAQAGPALQAIVDGTGAHVTFFGIPARVYPMQAASNPGGPWQDAGVAVEDDIGHYHFDDTVVLPAAYYRAVHRN
ncbi:MAG TPA: Ig-like domain-containing protein [Verrucomicrobiae bacterium]|nr:Ig-like domain-containing protein [Verrucomicrobiae bacterium]